MTRNCKTEKVNHELAGFVAENACKNTFSLFLKTGSVYLHESDKIKTKKKLLKSRLATTTKTNYY